jgi:hypothetical protein
MLLIVIAIIAAVWALVAAVVVGLCVSAARGDRALQTLPRRATWRTVCSNSFTSAQSDQFATYK